jgi:hypothetical protein
MLQALAQLQIALDKAQRELVGAEENARSARIAADNRVLEAARLNELIAELTVAMAHLEAVSG